MVHSLNGSGKQGAQVKAQQRHQRLKAAEPAANGGHAADGGPLHGQTLADGNRESIHAHAHCQQKQFPKSHKKYLQVE